MKVIKITTDGDEITRYGFISQMEHYIKQLLSDPIHASIGDYLKSHGVDAEGILPMLLHNPDKSDENNAILIRTERIKTDPETGRDQFCVKYKMPRKDYDKKMRRLYVDLFENYQTDNKMLNEEGEGGCIGGDCGFMSYMGGATSCGASSGQFIQPLLTNKKNGSKDGKHSDNIIRRDMPGLVSEKKTIYINEEQLAYLKDSLKEEAECDTMFGDFGFVAPAFEDNNGKKDEAFNHDQIMAKSFPGYKKKKN